MRYLTSAHMLSESKAAARFINICKFYIWENYAPPAYLSWASLSPLFVQYVASVTFQLA